MPRPHTKSVTLRHVRNAFILLALFSGCSTYQNVTGYFNTYFNAKKAFGEATETAELGRAKARDTLFFAPYKLDAATVAKFDKVIEKCSRLIEFYDQSNWVDDAILMIGESYVYQDENESAIRKFKELFDNFPASSLINEAKFWNAKAVYFTGKDDEALRQVKELFPEARAEGQSDIMIQTLMLEAQIYASRNDYAQAAQTYALAAQVEASDELRGIAQFQAALAFEKMDQTAEAAEAYAGVRKLSPSFDTEFKARIGEGRMLAKLGRYEQALRGMESLFDEPLKLEERGLVDLEIANTDWMMGDSAAAFDLYTLIDSVYRKSDASAKAQLRRGQIYEREIRNYKSARSFYDRAKVEYAQSEVTQPAQLRAHTFADYYTHYDNLHRYDSLLVKRLQLDSLALLTAATHADSVTGSGDILTARADTAAQPTGDSTAGAAAVAAVPPVPDTAATRQRDIAETAQPTPKAALEEADDEDRDRPLGRRRQGGGAPATGPRAITRLPKERIAQEETALPKGGMNDSLRAKNAPKTAAPPPPAIFTADSLRTLLATTYFELGGIFMLELQRPDSAAKWFDLLLERFPHTVFTPRALYAQAELRRSASDSAGVDSLYDLIMANYGESEYADQIRRVRGMERRAARVDSSMEEFAAAYRLLDSGNANAAVATLQDLVGRNPSSPSAPKAFYTIGWIYENMLGQLDSAAAWYERLVAAYPKTEYAAVAGPKLAVRKDPSSLSKFITVHEIQAVPKSTGTLRHRATAPPKGGDEEDLRPGRGRTEGVDADENADDEEEEPPPESDDDSDDDNN